MKRGVSHRWMLWSIICFWNEQVVSKDENITFVAVSKTMYGHYK